MLLKGQRTYWRFKPADADGLITRDGLRLARDERPIIYPMDLKKVTLGETVIYDKDSPGPPWFLLEIDFGKDFIPADADSFITADGYVLRTRGRKKRMRGV